jgi:hypothetical protein
MVRVKQTESRGDGRRGGRTQPAARRLRSIAIALALAALVVLFYVGTIVRLGGNMLHRPLTDDEGMRRGSAGAAKRWVGWSAGAVCAAG